MTEEKLDASYTPSLDFVMVMKMKESRTFCATTIFIFYIFNHIRFL